MSQIVDLLADFHPNEHPHLRYNPLKDEWVVVSPHRSLRPWAGQMEKTETEAVPAFDPKNPLCPGVTRPNGARTANYASTFVFTNDYPALLAEGPEPPHSDDPLFQAHPAKGTCKVMCYHPMSNVYLTSMTIKEVMDVVEEWVRQTIELGALYSWVQIFENRGEMMGCSNPHPHCQIWASNFLPNEARIKDANLKAYYLKHKHPMLQDYLTKELHRKERIVHENDEWVVLVPYWAVWPYETMLLPRRQVQRLYDLDMAQKRALAGIMQVIVAKYDNLFHCNFPYSMGWHGAPTGKQNKECLPYWTLHAMYYPPLLRSATVKKFMVGYEMLAQTQRDITPEAAAATLRGLPDVRFTD